MPTNVVKTPRDERLWKKAKQLAAKQGHAGEYDYIMGVYQRMQGEKSVAKSLTVIPQLARIGRSGINPSPEALKLQRMAQEPPKRLTPEMMLQTNVPIIRLEDVVRGLGLNSSEQNDWLMYLSSIDSGTNELVYLQQVSQKARGDSNLDRFQKKIILERSIQYYRNTRKDMEKALFIGPRGGRWADAAHTIPYDQKIHGKPKMIITDRTKPTPKVSKESKLDQPKPQKKKKIIVIDRTGEKPAPTEPVVVREAKPDKPGEKIPPDPAKIKRTPVQNKKPVQNKEDKLTQKQKLTIEQGLHVWGSRADISAVRTPEDLKNLPPALQAKVITKAKLLPVRSIDDELEAGKTPECVIMCKAIEACISTKSPDNLEGRQDYMRGIDFVARSLDACFTKEDVEDFVQDWQALSEGSKKVAKLSKEEYGDVLDEYIEHDTGKPPEWDWRKREKAREAIRAVRSASYEALREGNSEKHRQLGMLINEMERKLDAKGDEYSHKTLDVMIWKYGLYKYGARVRISASGGVSVYDTSKASGVSDRLDNPYTKQAIAMGRSMAALIPKIRGSKKYRSGWMYTANTPAPYENANRESYRWNRKELDEDQKIDALYDYFEPKKRKGGGGSRFRFKRERPSEVIRVGGREVGKADAGKFAADFNMPNVQFGKWVTDEDAQHHIKGAHEGLFDLADVIGVDPETISFKGRLSIGFGARGSGTALAHYELGNRIINITKIAGGGTLAHEWAHAFDNIIAEVADPTNTQARVFLSHRHTKGVSTPVINAVQTIMGSIYGSSMYTDARALSPSENGYYARPHEMFARAFEAYIEDKLEDNGRKSTYLVSGTKKVYTTKAREIKIDGELVQVDNPQPYPQGADRELINKGFEQLMEAIRETKALEKALIFLNERDAENLIKTLYIGPRGGKYQDSAHKIPWHGDDAGHKQTAEKLSAKAGKALRWFGTGATVYLQSKGKRTPFAEKHGEEAIRQLRQHGLIELESPIDRGYRITPKGKGVLQALTPERNYKKSRDTMDLMIDLEKSYFVGPRGGKWQDAARTIPYKEKESKPMPPVPKAVSSLPAGGKRKWEADRRRREFKEQLDAMNQDEVRGAVKKSRGDGFNLEKASVRGGKYYRRVAKKGGKGYDYYYTPEDYNKRDDAHHSGEDNEHTAISGKIHKCIEKAGEGGCKVDHFKELVKTYGAKKVAKCIKASCESGSVSYKKGKFYKTKQELKVDKKKDEKAKEKPKAKKAKKGNK